LIPALLLKMTTTMAVSAVEMTATLTLSKRSDSLSIANQLDAAAL
jgi:hypothetical protein